jgi:hypothetical protein
LDGFHLKCSRTQRRSKRSANSATTGAHTGKTLRARASRSNYANDQQQHQQSTFAAHAPDPFREKSAPGEFARAHTAGVFPVCFIVRAARSHTQRKSIEESAIVVRRETRKSGEGPFSGSLYVTRCGAPFARRVFCFIVCSSKSIASECLWCGAAPFRTIKPAA